MTHIKKLPMPLSKANNHLEQHMPKHQFTSMRKESALIFMLLISKVSEDGDGETVLRGIPCLLRVGYMKSIYSPCAGFLT